MQGNTVQIPRGLVIASGKKITADYTMQVYDSMLEAEGTLTVTLFSANQAFKKAYQLVNIGSGNVTITADGSDLIAGYTSFILLPHESITIVQNINGDGWLIL